MAPVIRRAIQQDIPVVDAIMRHPDVLPGALEGSGMTEADLPSLSEWFDKSIFLLVCDSETGEPGAVVIFDNLGDHSVEMHLCLLKQMRGPIGDQVIKDAVRWIFANTKTNRIHASFTATKRRLADKLERCGFFHSWPTAKNYYMETAWDYWAMSDKENMVRGSSIYAHDGVTPVPWDSGLVAAVGALSLAADEGRINVERFNHLADIRRWPHAIVRVHGITEEGKVDASVTIGNVAIKIVSEVTYGMEV